MRHFVNLALVPFFLTLMITGLMRFFFPFSLITTRLHIVFGIGISLLVALHIASRVKYYKGIFKNLKKKRLNNNFNHKTIYIVISLWVLLLLSGIINFFPTTSIIDLTYESKNRSIIFRSDEKSVYEPVDRGLRIKRDGEYISDLLIQIDWGKEYYNLKNNKLFNSANTQLAVWAESTNGTLIETLFLSEESAFNDRLKWGGYEQRRTDILPIWRNRFTTTTGIGQDGEETVFYSGATPDHSFSIQDYLYSESSTFILYLEINVANDPNEYYNSNKNSEKPGYTKPGIGQPSVLYGARINSTKQREWLLLELIGHGGDSHNDKGNIQYDLDKITTGKDIIEKVIVRIQRVDSTKVYEGSSI